MLAADGPVAAAAAAEPARPVKLEKAAADAAMKEIEKDRTDTEAWLKSGITSYLAPSTVRTSARRRR